VFLQPWNQRTLYDETRGSVLTWLLVILDRIVMRPPVRSVDNVS